MTSFWIRRVLIVLLLALVGCEERGVTSRSAPARGTPEATGLVLLKDGIVKWSVSDFFRDPPQVEFASDGSEYILAWEVPSDPGDYRKLMVKQAVFDFAGRPVAGAVDTKGLLTGHFVRLFPSVSWRQELGCFVQEAEEWGFSEDWSKGIRLNRATVGRETWVAEEWSLGPVPRMQFKKQLQGPDGRLRAASYLLYADVRCILLCFDEAYVMDEEDGRLTHQFAYGLRPDESRFAFYPGNVVIEPVRRLIACAAYDSKLVRIVEIDAPHRLLAELNAERPSPGLGVSRVTRLGFSGDHLIVHFHYGGRGILNPHDYIVVYDARNWQVCHKAPGSVSDLAISPGGDKLAYVRRHTIELFHLEPGT